MKIDESLAEKLQERRAKNVAYLKKHQFELYQRVLEFNLDDISLELREVNQGAELFNDGAPIYPGAAKSFASDEVNHFQQSGFLGQTELLSNFSLPKPKSGQYNLPRFFYSHVERILEPTNTMDESLDLSLYQSKVIPALSILGVGLGEHIQILLDHYEIFNLAVFENSMETFIISLYTADWYLWQEVQSQFGRRLSIHVGNLYHPDLVHAQLWNHNTRHWPLYPTMTYFYLHGYHAGSCGVEESVNAIQRLQTDRTLFMSSWGSYDDEINQINQAYHNLKNGIDLIKRTDKNPSWMNLPICIIGSGPSLDERIDLLKQMSPNAIIISCGSSITALNHHGIKPDIHLELESDYLLTVSQLQSIKDKEYLKDVTLIGPVQLNPHVLEFFDRSVLYLKEGSSLSTLDFLSHALVEGGGPTCTNAALGVAVYLDFKNIFLFGMDFGYRENHPHHATSSVYFDESADPNLRAAGALYKKETIRVEGIHGEILVPKSLRLALFRLQHAILDYNSRRVKIYNCSDGVKIEGTEWLSKNELTSQIERHEGDPRKTRLIKEELVLLLSAYGTEPKERLQYFNQLLQTLKTGQTHLKACCDKIKEIVTTHPIKNSQDYMACAHEINQLFEEKLRHSAPLIYRLLKGSFQHLLYIGLALGLREEVSLTTSASPSDRNSFLNHWEKTLSLFLTNLPVHFEELLITDNLELSQSWLTLSIYDQEPQLERYT